MSHLNNKNLITLSYLNSKVDTDDFNFKSHQMNFLIVLSGSVRISFEQQSRLLYEATAFRVSGVDLLSLKLECNTKILVLNDAREKLNKNDVCEILSLTNLGYEIFKYFNEISLRKISENEKELFYLKLLDLAFRGSKKNGLREIVVKTPKDPRAQKAFEFLEKSNFSLDLSELAKVSGASTRTLERIFQKETGETFSYWRKLLRMQEAIKLMQNDTDTVQISQKVGYKSHNYFIHMFKETFGLTPNQYLKELSSKNSQTDT